MKNQDKIRIQNALSEGAEMVAKVEDILSGGAGHNTGAAKLKSFMARIDRMEAEADALKEDLKEIWAEIKSAGFEVNALKALRKALKGDVQKRKELAEIVRLYADALGLTEAQLCLPL